MNRITLQVSMALVALAACAPAPTDANKDGIADGIKTPNTVSVVAPASPTGTVSGIIADTKFAAIQGADVVLSLGGPGEGNTGAVFKASTDVDGNFSFKNVPAGGSGQIVVTKSGYGAARLSINVPGVAGNIPLDNGNANVGVVLLTELSGTVKFYVYGSNGRVAKGARGLLEVTPAAFVTSNAASYGTAQGVTSVEATVDDSGALTFSGVPTPAEQTRINGQYALTVGAWDENGDGTYESLGFARTYSGSSLFISPSQTVLLPDARQSAALAIVSSNLDSLAGLGTLPFRNAVKGTDPVTVVFNQPVAGGTLLAVKVVQEDCSTAVAVKIDQKAPNLLTITPNTAWNLGSEYHLAIHATGTDSANTTAFIGSFWGIDPTTAKPVSTSVVLQGKKGPGNTNTSNLEPGDDLYVIFDTPTKYFGGGAAEAFVNFDLNSSGGIGGTGDVGEYGSTTGLSLTMAEPTFDANTSTFACKTNGYSTRWRINYTTIPSSGVPASTPMKIVVPKDSTASSGYETVWGQPFSGDFSGTLTIK